MDNNFTEFIFFSCLIIFYNICAISSVLLINQTKHIHFEILYQMIIQCKSTFEMLITKMNIQEYQYLNAVFTYVLTNMWKKEIIKKDNASTYRWFSNACCKSVTPLTCEGKWTKGAIFYSIFCNASRWQWLWWWWLWQFQW